MFGHLGFSYVGLLFLVMLFLPNLIWMKRQPQGYSAENEKKFFVVLERVGEVLTTCFALLFSDFNWQGSSKWSLWLGARAGGICKGVHPVEDEVGGAGTMKGFERKDQLFSLCGLNCGLCPMLLGKYCGGCGNGNQSCRIAKCSLAQGGMEYCYECGQYPCEKYQHIDEYDSFVTHRRRKADLARAQSIGIEQYDLEQQEKVQILSHLLSNYNDGRRKNFFCVAVNLLELSELQEAMERIQSNDELSSLPFKAQCFYVAEVLQEIADRSNIKLKLLKKK